VKEELGKMVPGPIEQSNASMPENKNRRSGIAEGNRAVLTEPSCRTISWKRKSLNLDKGEDPQ